MAVLQTAGRELRSKFMQSECEHARLLARIEVSQEAAVERWRVRKQALPVVASPPSPSSPPPPLTPAPSQPPLRPFF